MEKRKPRRTTPATSKSTRMQKRPMSTRRQTNEEKALKTAGPDFAPQGEQAQEPYRIKEKAPFPNKTIVLAGVLFVILVGLFLTNKGLLLAAMVNGKPIFRWQLTSVLVDRYGSQTLEGLITESLITQEASKEEVVVSRDEIDKRTGDILASFGGDVDLEELLSFQGLTREDFENQIRIQLYVEKILGKDITITDADIDAFIATNSAVLVSTEEAALKEEARQAILETEIGKKVQSWYTGLKDNASILRYIE